MKLNQVDIHGSRPRSIIGKFFGIIWKATLLLLIFAIGTYLVVDDFSSDYIYSEIDSIPNNKAGVLLGTSKYVPEGGINLYYKYRINAAVQLYRAGKIKKIIASGDNGTIHYNEPIKMQQDLIARGIPESDIQLDYAGFSTLDAVIRANAIFSQKSFTVISQEFHNSRAVFIARKKGLDVVAYNAKSVSNGYGFMTHLREYLARIKMLLDIYIFHTEPKFYGKKIDI